jgi:hypothetical protein
MARALFGVKTSRFIEATDTLPGWLLTGQAIRYIFRQSSRHLAGFPLAFRVRVLCSACRALPPAAFSDETPPLSFQGV